MTPSIIGTDVVERQVVDGVLVTHRLVSSKWYFPRWAQAVSYVFYSLFLCTSVNIMTNIVNNFSLGDIMLREVPKPNCFYFPKLPKIRSSQDYAAVAKFCIVIAGHRKLFFLSIVSGVFTLKFHNGLHAIRSTKSKFDVQLRFSRYKDCK